MMQNVKKGEVMNDIKKYNSDKKVTEILSKSLADIKKMYSGNDSDVQELSYSVDEAFEQYKNDYEKSLEIVPPNVTPVGSEVLTSACLMNILDHGSHLTGADFDIELMNQFKMSVDDTQIVVAKGPDCRQVEVGDVVRIRLKDFTRRINPNTVNSQEVTEIPLETIGDVNYLTISERNIKYILNPKN